MKERRTTAAPATDEQFAVKRLRQALACPSDFTEKVISLFRTTDRKFVDEVILVRTGRPTRFAETLARILGAVASEQKERIVVTSMPHRFGAIHTHAFIAVVQEACWRAECTFVNDNFVEIRPRASMTTFPTTSGRAAALEGVMEYRGTLKGKTVLLIDDVCVTGTSLRIAARQLREAGANEVLQIAAIKPPHAKDPRWEEKETRRVIATYFDHPSLVLEWPGVTSALREIVEFMCQTGYRSDG